MGWPPDLGAPWFVALVLTRLAAFVGAILLARRRPEYAPIALLLGFAVVADIIRPALTLLVLAPARELSGLPYTGSARVAFHATQALFVGWSAGIAAVAVRAFLGRRPWVVALVYIATIGALAAAYPELRRERLQSAILAITLASIATAVIAAAVWWQRRPAHPPDPPRIAIGVVVVFEVAALLGPYAAGAIDWNWPIAQVIYTGLYVTLAIVEALWLRRA